MPDMEKIIRKLEELLVFSRYNDSVGWNPDNDTETLEGALALLKVQKPRVMTLEEVQVSIDPVWLEGGMAGGTWAMMPFTREHSIEFVADGVCTVYPAFAIGEYGKTWRCWTSRPTDEQREAVKWE